MDIEKERREWEETARKVPLPANVAIEPREIASIYCELVSCQGADTGKVLLYAHGGGFTTGSCITHRELAAHISLASRIPVLLVDYRLAPEHPFPAGVEDIVHVYRSLLKRGMSPQCIAFGGDSSGGNLALAAAVLVKRSGNPLPAGLVLLSPWLDLGLTGESMKSRAEADKMVTREGLALATGHYLGSSEVDPTDPLASPVFADLRGFPPILVHVGDDEVLLSDSERLGERAIQSGVDARVIVWPSMGHVFPADATLQQARQAIRQISEFLIERFSAAESDRQ